jgi:hypothetical protein
VGVGQVLVLAQGHLFLDRPHQPLANGRHARESRPEGGGRNRKRGAEHPLLELRGADVRPRLTAGQAARPQSVARSGPIDEWH